MDKNLHDFPYAEVFHPEYGMTLRDYFAAQALGVTYFEPAHQIAKRCYQIADAMMDERAD